jgi:hypothetical protein
VHSECAKQANVQKPPNFLTPYFEIYFKINHNMPQKNDENQLNLAIQAIKHDPKLKVYTASKIYGVDHRKLSRRLRGMPSRRVIQAKSRKMTDLEEIVLVEHILNLASKGFPPRLCVVEEIANRIIATRQGERVGPR